MEVRIINLEKKLINLKKIKKILSDKELLKFCRENKKFLNSYVRAKEFEGDFKDFSLNLYNSIIKYPNILDEIDKVVSNIIINKKEIEDKLLFLSELSNYNKNLDIIMFYGGFNDGICTYGDNIYYAMEWFVNPDNINMKNDEIIYRYLKQYSINPEDIIYNTVIHEFVHICSCEIEDKSNPIWHLIEEGRAAYITNQLDKRDDLGLLMSEIDLKWCKENEKYLFNEMFNVISENDENKYFDFISTRRNICGVSRTGYFIGYKLIETYMKTIDKLSQKEKIKKLLCTNETEVYFKTLRNMCL